MTYKSIGIKNLNLLWQLLFCLLCFGCTDKSDKKTSSIILTDDLDREVLLTKAPKRIMALAPSMTEMLFAVCDTASIVARTHNCNYPEASLQKPVVVNMPMDYEQLLRVKPDLIFTVEGVTSADVTAHIEKLGIPVYYQKYDSVADIFRGMIDIGRIMNREKQAKKLVDSLQSELAALIKQTNVADTPSILAVTWPDPIYVYGANTVFSDKLRMIGARNAVSEFREQTFPALTREHVLMLNPDVILGYTFEEMDQTFFNMYPELKQVNAYKNKRIYKPNDDLMSRPSPRVVESIRELQQFIF